MQSHASIFHRVSRFQLVASLPARIKTDVHKSYHVSYDKSHSSCGPLINGSLIERYWTYTAIPWLKGGGPRVVVSTAAFHARVRGSVPGLGGLKETKLFLPHPRVKVSIVGSLRDREVACSASDRQGSNFESCVWRTVSSQSSHHPQEVLLAQFSLYVHKGGLKPDSFHFLPWLKPIWHYNALLG